MADKNLTQDIVKWAYNSGLITIGTILSSKVTNMIFRVKSPTVDFKTSDVIKLSADVGLGSAVIGCMQKQGIIPSKIMK